ncbi:uncharacterized protein N7487_010354 [Penicillium crustosum]|uniref:uncharacterized protein n=1 Tax=Penicillium crustosum TaxID=36656 RepID=UPI0023906ABE|nr:uncharacterized protein N7487_010354 [Penicillium crustosum]KAJ5396051.1 hypothetical protein N7487_010354 [Penicillium crustosum]
MFEIQFTPTFLESLAPIGTRRSDAVHNPRSGSATKQPNSDDQHYFGSLPFGADFGYDHQYPTIVF